MTYQEILPFLVSADPEGSKMHCVFQLPGSDQVIESEGPIRRSDSIKSTVTRAIKRNASRELRRTTSRLLRSALGSGFLGRTASTVVRSTTRNSDLGKGYSQEEKEEAIVAAYQKVAHLMQPSNAASQEVAETPSSIKVKSGKVAVSEFEEQLKKFPVKDSYDQEILARMLAELATVDGALVEEEKEFLSSIIPPEIGSIDDFLNREPLSPIECEEVSGKAKVTIYMAAWALSLIDLELNPDETKLLEEFGQMLGLSSKQMEESIRKAKYYLLENHIDATSSREELYEIAGKIELNQDDALRCQIQLKKRG